MNKNKFDIFGRLSWLWSSSSLHRSWSVSMLSEFLLPPIELGQFVLLEKENMPVAYCSWAFLNLSAEIAYLKNPSKLQISDWHSGDRLWFIDYISPFRVAYTIELKSLLKKKFPHTVARAVRVRTHSKQGKVISFIGEGLSTGMAKQMLDTYFNDIKLGFGAE